MSLGLLTLEIYIPGCQSLKEKRGRLKPLIAKLHREFNVSVAEIDYQDRWNETILACALVSNDNGYTQRALQKVVRWIEINWRDVDLIADQLEIL
ncbi:MAG: DUF503 domain-containing protein [Anaerolineales bacterium]|jgi:uncharacterized protein YlxP (DUF503 family)